MSCSKCGFSNPEQARFCGGCGLAVATIECQYCHAENGPGSRFCSACGQSLAKREPEKELLSEHAERRILSVLFCDLVDSTVLVDRFDPELGRMIIRDFQIICKGIIENNGGRISTYLGDGVVALFSHHESNAERAINTALQINRKIEQGEGSFSQIESPVKVRCGIATGLAIVGDDMLGHSQVRLETAIGLPMNLAARIQSLADPGGLTIDDASYKATRGLFQVENGGCHKLKGIKERQQVWGVIAEKSISSRFVAHAASITPMVDRVEVLKQLMTIWKKSVHSDAQVVIISGEAGVGKSRIIRELADIISIENDYNHLEYQCSSYHTHTALHPVINRIKAVAGIEYGESSANQLRKLEVLVRGSSNDFEHDMPAFADLLALSGEDVWPFPNLDPDEKKKWVFDTLQNNVLSLSESTPLLITLEDVHWIDPTTLELVQRVANVIAERPILLLLTSRPDFAENFLELPGVTALEVDRLPEKYAQQLLDQVIGETSLSPELQEEIVQRTEGVPLYIEELSKSLLESLSSEYSVHYGDMPRKINLPGTLQESLLARLDRLPEMSKSIAQLAAVIGRDFSFDILEKVAGYQDKNLYQVLTPLLQAQMVTQRKAPPNAEFTFKHALFRDAAYEAILKSDLVDIHHRIGTIIEEDYPGVAQLNPELLARHFTEGQDYEKAVQYRLAAGKKASQSSANTEARKHLQMGISLLDRIKSEAVKDQLELELLLVLGPMAMSTTGAGSTETHKIYKRALKLSGTSSDTRLRFITLWNNWRMSIDEGFSNAVVWADELQDFAESSKEVDQLLQAHHCQWGTLYNLGDQARCHENIESGLKLYDISKHAHHASVYGGHDPKVCALGQSSLSLWLRGYPEQSIQRMEEARQFADSLEHVGSTLHNIDICLMLHKFMSNFDQLMDEAEGLSEFCRKENLLDYEAKVNIFQGWAICFKGKAKQGLSMLEEGNRNQEDTGTWEDRPVYKEMQAQVKQKLGLYDSGIADIDSAIKDARKSGVSYWNAELYRRKGELLIANNSVASFKSAENAFNQSIEIAVQQNAKSLELRGATSLAQLYINSGDYNKANATLAPVYNWFSEGRETRDLRKAAKVLDSVTEKLS